MALMIWQDVQKIRESTYGIETREPIADALEEGVNRRIVKEHAEDNIQRIHDREDELYPYLAPKDAEMAAKEPRLTALEALHATRINRYTNLEMKREIDWIEKITHIIHDPPTIYKVTSASGVTVAAISGSSGDYKATDSNSTDSVTLISDSDYKFTLGSTWSKIALDNPTHEEYEYVTHWVPDYRLTFKRANEA